MKMISSPPRPHAVVIGSGFGGLAAAVRLLARGFRVTVVEKLDAPGGRAYTFRQDGFTFDAGPTIITAPYLLEELWSLHGERMQDAVDLRPIDPFYVIRFDDGTEFRASADVSKMREEVARFAPEDLEGFDRHLAASEAIYEVAFAELADQPFHRFSTMLKTIPDMIRLQGYRSVFQKVSSNFKNPKMRLVFSFHPLLIGGNPLSTTAFYCLIAHLEKLHGVHYAMGGTGAIVNALTQLITRRGGALRMNSEVAEILTRAGAAAGVRLASGEMIDAEVVVSNADPAWTYGKLLGTARRRRWTDAKLNRASYSMGLFVWYFGTDRRFDDVYHHTMVMGPRYEGLLRDIFVHKTLTEDFSLYLHRPTASDPSLAPDGCDSFYVLSPVPNLRGGADWTQEAKPYRDRVLQRLEETVMPGLGRHIISEKIMTPLDFRDRLNSRDGAAFAMEPKLFQSAWFRPHNLSEEVDNLFLVGAGTHPGAGVPGVIASARVLDQVVPDAASFQQARA